MHLLLVGISHRTAPVELRERVDFQARGLELALRTLASRQPGEIAVLSTCNPAALSIPCEDIAAETSELVPFASAFHEVEVKAIEPHVYDVTQLEAARHLLLVAAHLD